MSKSELSNSTNISRFVRRARSLKLAGAVNMAKNGDEMRHTTAAWVPKTLFVTMIDGTLVDRAEKPSLNATTPEDKKSIK
eukprot:scaffold847_cov98-Cylindrotheca_fusiformis.AAC.1